MATGFSSTQTFSMALPIFSGLIGVWAEKAFPTMLIAPGSFYLQIRFAKVAQAFQFTMDPCRRIFGTYRDYVPSIGFTDGYITEHSGNVFADGRRRYENNLSAGTNTWLALTDNAANGTDFAFKGWRVQPKTNAGGTYDISFTTAGQNPVTTTNCEIENFYHSAYMLQKSYFTDTDENGYTIMVTDHAA